MIIRTNRKSFIKSNGIENYRFDFDKEIIRYRFLCGEKLSKKQWRMLTESDRTYTYDAWSRSIRNKYDSYTIEGLKEFSRYLNHCHRSVISIKEFLSIFVSAILTLALTFYVSELIEMAKGEELVLGILTEIVVFIIIFIGIVLLLYYVIINGIKLFSDKNINSNFYFDFKVVIDELIEEKSKEKNPSHQN